MKTQLIMLPNPIVVSDEELTLGDTLKDCFYFFKGKVIKREYSHHKEGKKIIAGIPELYQITYSDEASKTLQERCGWVDIDKLSKEKYKQPLIGKDTYLQRRQDFTEGFRLAQSLNEKKYSEKDMLLAYKEGSYNRVHKGFKEFIQSLSQPKVFDCLVEMEPYSPYDPRSKTGRHESEDDIEPKIIKNSIKILKVL